MSHEAINWARRQRLHKTPKSVLMYLADRANKKKGYTCFPGQKTIATDLGMSERTVRMAVQYLEEMGFLARYERRREDGRKTSNGYELIVNDGELTYESYSEWYAHRHGSRQKDGLHRQELPVDQRQVLPTSPAGPASPINQKPLKEERTASSAENEEYVVLSLNALDDARKLVPDIHQMDDDTLWRMYVKAQCSSFDTPDPGRNQANEFLAGTISQEIRKRLLG